MRQADVGWTHAAHAGFGIASKRKHNCLRNIRLHQASAAYLQLVVGPLHCGQEGVLT